MQTYDESTSDLASNINELDSEQALKKLNALKETTGNLEECEPPAHIWQNIENKLAVEKPYKTKTTVKPWIYGIAASLFTIAGATLLWSNYKLQQDFEQVLVSNQLLEEQLLLISLPMITKVGLLDKLREIDIQLYQAKSQKEKVSLLKIRKETIETHLESAGEGNENEFSI